MGVSGKDIGDKYLNDFNAYLERTPELPTTRNGLLNVVAIAEGAGVPRQSFYKNEHIRAALENARQARGIPDRAPVMADGERKTTAAPAYEGDRKAKALERRLTQLEQQNAALVAENAELRRQLKVLRLQVGREDMMLETGRRILPPRHDG